MHRVDFSAHLTHHQVSGTGCQRAAESKHDAPVIMRVRLEVNRVLSRLAFNERWVCQQCYSKHGGGNADDLQGVKFLVVKQPGHYGGRDGLREVENHSNRQRHKFNSSVLSHGRECAKKCSQKQPKRLVFGNGQRINFLALSH